MSNFYAGTHYCGSILRSDSSFLFNDQTNQMTTGVNNQIFYLENPTDNNTRMVARVFIFTPIGSDINFDLNNNSNSRLKCQDSIPNGIENEMLLSSFKVNSSMNGIFEFVCII